MDVMSRISYSLRQVRSSAAAATSSTAAHTSSAIAATTGWHARPQGGCAAPGWARGRRAVDLAATASPSRSPRETGQCFQAAMAS